MWKRKLTSVDCVDYAVYQPVQIRVALAQLLDLLHRMQHSCVMFATEHAPDFGQGRLREFLDKVHGDLPGVRHRTSVGFLLQERWLRLKAVRDRAQDRLHGDSSLLIRDQVF